MAENENKGVNYELNWEEIGDYDFIPIQEEDYDYESEFLEETIQRNRIGEISYEHDYPFENEDEEIEADIFILLDEIMRKADYEWETMKTIEKYYGREAPIFLSQRTKWAAFDEIAEMVRRFYQKHYNDEDFEEI